jgi:SAM-dependent methyltransferase
MAEKQSSRWYEEAFDEYYVDLYAHRDGAEADLFVETLSGHVDLRGALVLDLACGGGRYLTSLDRAGAVPVGLDLSRALLEVARAGGRGMLLRGDMRALPLRDGSADGVISMFTSFGYFSRMADERAVLEEICRCLRPGGWFVLDYMNSSMVRRSLEAESRRRVGELEALERRTIDEAGDRVVKEVRLMDRGHLVRSYSETVRLIGSVQLNRMIEEAGLETQLMWGGYSGEGYEEASSPRLIVFSKKG